MTMRSPQRGFTLIELIVAITVVGIAATTILGTIAAVARRSADPMLQQQAIAIAQAYLDEIGQRWVVYPNGPPPNTGRGSWNLVNQYNGLIDAGARDQFGNAIAALSAYTVSVSVVQTAALPGIAAARRIDVTVTNGPAVNVTLSGYRTNY